MPPPHFAPSGHPYAQGMGYGYPPPMPPNGQGQMYNGNGFGQPPSATPMQAPPLPTKSGLNARAPDFVFKPASRQATPQAGATLTPKAAPLAQSSDSGTVVALDINDNNLTGGSTPRASTPDGGLGLSQMVPADTVAESAAPVQAPSDNESANQTPAMTTSQSTDSTSLTTPDKSGASKEASVSPELKSHKELEAKGSIPSGTISFGTAVIALQVPETEAKLHGPVPTPILPEERWLALAASDPIRFKTPVENISANAPADPTEFYKVNEDDWVYTSIPSFPISSGAPIYVVSSRPAHDKISFNTVNVKALVTRGQLSPRFKHVSVPKSKSALARKTRPHSRYLASFGCGKDSRAGSVKPTLNFGDNTIDMMTTVLASGPSVPAEPVQPAVEAPTPAPEIPVVKPKPVSWAALFGKPGSKVSAPLDTLSTGPSSIRASPSKSTMSLDAESEVETVTPRSNATTLPSTGTKAPRPVVNYAAAAATKQLSPQEDLVKLLTEGMRGRHRDPLPNNVPRGLVNTGNMCFANTVSSVMCGTRWTIILTTRSSRSWSTALHSPSFLRSLASGSSRISLVARHCSKPCTSKPYGLY